MAPNEQKSASARLRVLLVDAIALRAAALQDHLADHGHRVLATHRSLSTVQDALRAAETDALLIVEDAPDPDLFERLGTMLRQTPVSAVVFARRADPATIPLAMRAGVSGYVVDSWGARQLQPILDAALARFREQRRLHQELDALRSEIHDHRAIERATNLLGQQRKIEPDQALALLQRSADAQGVPLAQVARSMLDSADLLGVGVS